MTSFFCSFLVDQNCIFSFAGYQLSLLELLKKYHAILIYFFKHTVQVLIRTKSVFLIIKRAEGSNPDLLHSIFILR